MPGFWKKKSAGKIELVTGMYFLIFLVLILTAQNQLHFFVITGSIMEDALAASNLASAILDVREYGISHTVQIASPDTAYRLYQEALQKNLGLDSEGENPELSGGPVKILEYAIYNVRNQDVTVYSYDESGNCRSWTEAGGLHHTRTPDGTVVDATSVYSRILFPVRGILGISVEACKDKTVDIVSSPTGEEGR